MKKINKTIACLLLFVVAGSSAFSAKKKAKASDKSPVETYEDLYNEYTKSAFETAEMWYELAMTEFAEEDFKDALRDFKSAFEMYEMSEKYEVIVNKALEIYFELNGYPEKYEQKFFDLKLNAMISGIQASEDARLYLASKKDEVMQKALPLYYALISLCADYNDPKSAFFYSELSRSRGFLDEIGIETGLNLDGITDEQRSKYRELTKQITSIKQKINAENEKAKDKVDNEAVEKYKNELEVTNKKLTDLENQILEDEPRFEYFKNTDPVDFQEARTWCGNDKAVLEYVIWEDDDSKKIKPYCIMISKRKVVCVPLDSEFDYSAAAKEFRELLTSRKSLADKELSSLNSTLYEKLITPVLLEIPNSIYDIVIVPDGAISFIPLDVLSQDGKNLFGAAYNLSLSPSVSVSMMSNLKDYTFSDKMLGIGNPVYSKEDNGTDRAFTMKFLAAPAASSNANSTEKLIKKYVEEEDAGHYFATKQISWCNIPGTGEEIHNIQSNVFGKDLFKIVETKAATEQTLKDLSESKKLADYSVIHFACHGYFDSEYPQMSSIVFSEVSTDVDSRKGQDGYLTLSEAAILNLNAELVNLSACQTGLAKIKKGEGMSGLVRSFLVAGARKVGVTLWCVDDEATCEFMTRMYSKVDSGFSYAEAYSAVKDEFRKIEKWSSPYYWAAFVLYE